MGSLRLAGFRIALSRTTARFVVLRRRRKSIPGGLPGSRQPRVQFRHPRHRPIDQRLQSRAARTSEKYSKSANPVRRYGGEQ